MSVDEPSDVAALIEALGDRLGVSLPAEADPATELAELGLDSLHMLEVVDWLDPTGASANADDPPDLVTLGDLYDLAAAAARRAQRRPKIRVWNGTRAYQ